MNTPHISLAAEKIGSILGLTVTNSILLTWIVMAFLFYIAFRVSRNIQRIPGNLQSVVEVMIEGLYDLFKSVVGTHNIDKFFPLLATIFFFVIFSNWFGLLPIVGPIQVHKQIEIGSISKTYAVEENTHETEGITEAAISQEGEHLEEGAVEDEHLIEENHAYPPLLRGPTADLNTTLAIAIIAFFSLQYYGFQTLGKAYLSKYLNFSDPIMFFVGLLEIVSDLSKILSFAFRLFGNIFAGEVLLTVMAFLMPLIAPLPFIGLELFVGFIQALVFAMLTAVFLNMATMAHDGH